MFDTRDESLWLQPEGGGSRTRVAAAAPSESEHETRDSVKLEVTCHANMLHANIPHTEPGAH